MKRLLFLRFALLLSICVGCSQARYRDAVPQSWANRVEPRCFDQVRYIAEIGSETAIIYGESNGEDASEGSDTFFGGGEDYAVLALSGGGSDGAYAGGFLKGWSQSGTRPEFKVVTGVSTGAMIATFAFLGSEYDSYFERFYMESDSDDVYKERGLLSSLTSNSLYRVQPLKQLLDRHITCELLEKVAEEYKKGRRIYFSTTDLDTQRMVIWDMGKIAAEGTQASLDLYKNVLLASSSIPVYFPPVYIRVKADDCHYEEMHVDGGTVSMAFFPSNIFDHLKEKGASEIKLYTILSGSLHWQSVKVEDRILPIASRAVETVTLYHSLSDIRRLWMISKEKGVEFHLAHIPDSHKTHQGDVFSSVEMRRLFEVGRSEAVEGYDWKREPPFFRP